MRGTPGKALLLIGVLHEIVGVAAGLGALPLSEGAPRNLFREILAAGVVGAIDEDRARSVLFWFLLSGLLLMMLGALLDRWEERGDRLPSSIGWQLVLVALGGGLLIPVSGFWLLLVPGVWVLRRASGRSAMRAGALQL